MLKRIITAFVLTVAVVAAAPKHWSTREADADAERDIRAHKIKICLWGGYAPQPVGIPDQYRRLIREYPTLMVGQGCTVYDEVLNERQREYAETYNSRVLAYLLKRRQ